MAFEAALIRSTRNAGTPINGYREDLVIGDVIGLSLTNVVGVPSTYKWELIGFPEFSSAGGSGGNPRLLSTASTASFTVDDDATVHRDGTYVVRCTLNAGSGSQRLVEAALVRPTGLTIPGVSGSLKLRKLGWFEGLLDTSLSPVLAGYGPALNRWLEAIRGVLAGGGGSIASGEMVYGTGSGITSSSEDAGAGNTPDLTRLDYTSNEGGPPFSATQTIGGELPLVLSGKFGSVTGLTQLAIKNAANVAKPAAHIVLSEASTWVGNVGAGEDDLQVHTVPANQLATQGQWIEFEFVFTFAANANSKRVRLYYAGNLFYDSTAQVQNGGVLIVRGRIVRGTTNSFYIPFTVQSAATVPLFTSTVAHFVGTVVFGSSQIVKSTGTAVADNDVQNTESFIRYVGG